MIFLAKTGDIGMKMFRKGMKRYIRLRYEGPGQEGKMKKGPRERTENSAKPLWSGLSGMVDQ